MELHHCDKWKKQPVNIDQEWWLKGASERQEERENRRGRDLAWSVLEQGSCGTGYVSDTSLTGLRKP